MTFNTDFFSGITLYSCLFRPPLIFILKRCPCSLSEYKEDFQDNRRTKERKKKKKNVSTTTTRNFKFYFISLLFFS